MENQEQVVIGAFENIMKNLEPLTPIGRVKILINHVIPEVQKAVKNEAEDIGEQLNDLEEKRQTLRDADSFLAKLTGGN